jgi:hypothetical protein
MEEALDRIAARYLSNAVSHGQMNFGDAFLLFLLICGGIAVLSYACKEAKQGKPGCLIIGLVVSVLLVVMLNGCQ